MMRLVKKHPLCLLFILGFILRISLLFIDYSWDVNSYIVWAKDLRQYGFNGFYDKQSSEVYGIISPNYPPLSLFIFYLLYPLQSIIYKIAWWLNLAIPIFPSNLIFFIQERIFLAAMFKLPAIAADLGIAWLCYLFAKRILSKNQVTEGGSLISPSSRSYRRGIFKLLIPIFILFNPAFFYNSSLWGQIDSLPIFFVLASIYFLLFSNKYLFSSILFVTAILFKQTALIYLPIYIVFFISKYRFTNFLKAFLLSVLFFYFLFIPFLSDLKNPLLPFLIYVEKIVLNQSLPFVTNGAFNFWVLFTGFKEVKDTTLFLFGISYRMWGYIITGFFTLFILFRFTMSSLRKPRLTWRKQGSRLLDSHFRGNDNSQNFFYATFLISLVAFLFLTKMHERYSLLPLAFLLLATLKNQKLLKWFVILSIISFLNHYHSWPVPKINLIFAVISNPQVVLVLSLSNVILFSYLLKKYLSFRT